MSYVEGYKLKLAESKPWDHMRILQMGYRLVDKLVTDLRRSESVASPVEQACHHAQEAMAILGIERPRDVESLAELRTTITGLYGVLDQYVKNLPESNPDLLQERLRTQTLLQTLRLLD